MIDENNLHEEAEAIRNETAADAPELAEHDRVAELERQLEESKSKALYAAAEAQNVRRRLEADKIQASTYAVTGFARDMLSVRDHLDRALSHVPEAARADESQKSFLEGIESTLREIDSIFARNGIERIAAKGLPLDPNKHQAMIEMPSDQEPGTVIEWLTSRGLTPRYLLNTLIIILAAVVLVLSLA